MAKTQAKQAGTQPSKGPLRLEQYETVLYNENLNPHGIPESVVKALSENLTSISKYPEEYTKQLKKAIALYNNCDIERIVLGTGISDLLRLYVALLAPKKAMLFVPSFTEYEHVLSTFGCELDYYELEEEKDFKLDISKLVTTLDSSYDMIILGNPNNPTSQIVSRDDLETLVAVCKELDIFLIVDEMYIEFTENYEELTAIPLTDEYTNLAVLRSVSKFFAAPGIRLGYAIMNNPENMEIINLTATPNNISTLTAIAGIAMFNDKRYIKESLQTIYTERNLIYSAMATNKNVKLYRPSANFMLVKLLKEDVTAGTVAANCNMKGIVLRNCANIRGLSDRYIRFCFMNPKQNDLLVNSILEQL